MADLVITPEKELLFAISSETAASTVTLTLRNASTTDILAFKVKTTAPRSYLVKPNQGYVNPNESADVQVVLQPLKAQPSECNDRFLIQSAIVKEVPYPADFWQTIEKKSVTNHKMNVAYQRPDGVIIRASAAAPHEGSSNRLIPSPLAKDNLTPTAENTEVRTSPTTAQAEPVVEPVPNVTAPSTMPTYSPVRPEQSPEFLNLKTNYDDIIKKCVKITEERDQLAAERDRYRKELEQSKLLRQRQLAASKTREGENETKDLAVKKDFTFALWHVLLVALICFLLGRLF